MVPVPVASSALGPRPAHVGPRYRYGHDQAWHDGNGHSHLQATLLGPSLSVPVAEDKPVLGCPKKWQGDVV